MFFIDWMMTQSAVTLYIYRVGWTYPAKNLFYRSRSTKILIVLGLLLDWSDKSDPPVRPVGLLPDRPQYQTGQTAWSDRSRPILVVNICLSVF